MLPKFLILGCVSGCALIAIGALADDKKAGFDIGQVPPASAKTGVTYTNDIQPIFEKSCYPCHGPKTPKPKGKRRLDSLEWVMKGGEDGAVIVPGDSAKSPLLGNISHLGDPDDFMPPPKNKGHILPLTKEQIGLVRAWVEQGAK
jgi:mono/diheme cytochrome c family protein